MWLLLLRPIHAAEPKGAEDGRIPGHPAPSSGQAQPEQVSLAMSSQVLDFSTTSSGNPVLTTLIVEKVSHLFKWYFLCLFLCPLPLVLPLGITEPSFHPDPIRPSDICRDIHEAPQEAPLLQAEQSWL